MPPLAAVPDLDRELDELYAKPLDEFTKARNDLATRLRKAHQSQAAEEIRGLKKPSVVAWAANALARTHPDLVGELLTAGEELREVQQRALGGDVEASSELPAAAAREREAIKTLVTAAHRELGARASPATLDRLSQTLRAAAVDPGRAAMLAAGRLTEEWQAVGFGPLEMVEPRPGTKEKTREDMRRLARERATALRSEAKRAAAEARAADRAADDAERGAARLRAEAQAKAAEAERAALELAAAEQELERKG
jgi:hypothetical protein